MGHLPPPRFWRIPHHLCEPLPLPVACRSTRVLTLQPLAGTASRIRGRAAGGSRPRVGGGRRHCRAAGRAAALPAAVDHRHASRQQQQLRPTLSEPLRLARVRLLQLATPAVHMQAPTTTQPLSAALGTPSPCIQAEGCLRAAMRMCTLRALPSQSRRSPCQCCP